MDEYIGKEIMKKLESIEKRLTTLTTAVFGGYCLLAGVFIKALADKYF